MIALIFCEIYIRIHTTIEKISTVKKLRYAKTVAQNKVSFVRGSGAESHSESRYASGSNPVRSEKRRGYFIHKTRGTKEVQRESIFRLKSVSDWNGGGGAHLN